MPGNTTPTPLTREQRDELLRLRAKVDEPEPLTLTVDGALLLDANGLRVADTSWDNDEERVTDLARYFAAAANAVPALLAALDAAEARVEELESERQQLRDEIARMEIERLRKIRRDNQ